MDDTSVLTATGVEVAGELRPLLSATWLSVPAGSVVLAVGEPGHGHTALALALSGRVALAAGRVDIDGRSLPRALQQQVALVDVPGVSEPDEVVDLATIVGEELAMAGQKAGRAAVHTWLAERDLAELEDLRMEDVPGLLRIRILAELAATRPGVMFLVVTMPERHGGLVAGYLDEAQIVAGWGFGVLVTASPSVADLLDVPVQILGEEVVR